MCIDKQLNNRGVSHMVLTKTLKNKMRKIYSLVLMATMLLMGTNAWADAVSVATDAQLVDAFTSIPAERTITLTDDIELLSTSTANPLIIDGGQVVTLDLNGHSLSGYTDPVMRVNHGKLTITGTGIFTSRIDAVVLKGSTESTDADYSVLEVGENVKIIGTNSDYILWVTNNNGCAYGAKMIINGEARSAKAGLYINGNVQKKDGNVPEIYVNATGKVIAADNEVGIYAAGYGKWYIKGYVSGGAGIYAKAGDFAVSDNAVVEATASTYQPAEPNGNGYTGGMGCAIIQDSKNGYAGGMTLIVTGDATLKSDATDGYAIQEIKTDATQSKTENIVISGGTINGNVNMTGEVQEQVVLNGTITGGTFSTDISGYLDPTKGALEQTANGYEVVEGCVAMLNGNGLATFSSPNYNVVLPANVTAWIATGMTGDVLNLTKVAENAGDILPQNAGLILWGAANTNLSLYKSTTDAVDVTGNLLKPAKAWADENFSEAYILHGNELWLYNGTEFKAGKAFLPKTAVSSGAPKRVSMIFNQTDATTAVENVETQNVKAVKFVGEDGQLYIRRGEAVYTVQGQVVK